MEDVDLRRRARTDANQSEIVAWLRGIGASVQDTSAVGGGFPDLVVGFRGATYLLELKDGGKSPSRRKLTPDQERWHATWSGQAAIVKDLAEAMAVIGARTISVASDADSAV